MASFSGVPRRDLVWQRRKPADIDLSGWRAAVVGGTGGIGQALARLLAQRGCEVTVVGRTFRDSQLARVSFIKADLESMREAKRVAEELAASSWNLVVLTTGIFAAKDRQTTREGLERDMAVSYLSRLQLLRGLAPALAAQPAGTLRPRVFVMGFPGTMNRLPSYDDLNADRSYEAMPVHMNTVVGNETLVLDAVQRYPQVSFFGLNPGLIKSDIRSNFLGAGTLRLRVVEGVIGLLMPSTDQYAARTLPLLVSPDLEGHSGAMFNAKGRAIHPSRGMDSAYVAGFTKAAEALIARAMAA